MSEGRLVGRGLHANVWLSPDGKAVHKRYISGHRARDGHLADHERLTLLRVNAILASVPGVRAPRPYSSDSNARELVMEFCPGVPLHLAVADTLFAVPGEIDRIAHDLARALFLLAGQLSVDELDLSPRNTLYDRDRDELILIDFTPRTLSVALPEHTHVVDYVLASFLTAALMIPLHREHAANLSASRRILLLSRRVVRYLGNWHEVDRPAVRALAWRHFDHRRRNRGVVRLAWFSSIGKLLFGVLLWRATSRTAD